MNVFSRVGGYQMHRRIITILFVLLLIVPSMTILQHKGAGTDFGLSLPETLPTRTLTTNMTGGLYNGLITYEDVALIVNNNSEISREIGTYFAMKRGLPEMNIINIKYRCDGA